MTENKNIHEAIISIMKDVGYVQKQKGRNLQYTYAGEAALISALRPAMVKNNVFMSVLSITHERGSYQTAKGTTMNTTIVNGTIEFHHAVSESSIVVAAVGEGADIGDKSANKAMTGMYKYALRQTFMIETGDDPDSFKSEPAAPKQRTWTDDQLKAVIDCKAAENDFQAKAILKNSNLQPPNDNPGWCGWYGKTYRSIREEGLTVEDAAERANKGYIAATKEK